MSLNASIKSERIRFASIEVEIRIVESGFARSRNTGSRDSRRIVSGNEPIDIWIKALTKDIK